ncbi:hypothetical protein ACQ4LE_009758 [Meloidogyne hapla]|uniref:Fucosyltransferase n=1 Tax=Meloidogyne hapla TaxID=6305 RepID=A0A1I8BUB1_MELHA
MLNKLLKIKNIILFSLLKFECSESKDNLTNLPIILGWNDFFNTGNVIGMVAPYSQTSECHHKCIYSDNKTNYLNASAIVFHGNSQSNGYPSERNSNQIYALYNLESPYNFVPDIYPTKDFFNLTISYLAEDKNNLHAPYGALHRIDKNLKTDDIWTEEEILKKVKNKTKLAIAIISNCDAISSRDLYIKELSKYINLTLYGKCYQKSCDKNCYENELDSHFFYLAFENSVCRHYLTEKFWYPFRKLAVPVVLSRASLQGLNLPSDSFIGADDFDNAKDLAEFLIKMSRNEKEYLRFFNWIRFYRKQSNIEPSERAICRLCQLAHTNLKPGTITIPDIYNYWVKGGQCIKRFAWWKLIANRSKIKEKHINNEINKNKNILINEDIQRRLLLEEDLKQFENFYLSPLNIFCILTQILCLIWFAKHIFRYWP